MSRGLGKVEKAVLKVFEDDPLKGFDSIELTIRIHGKQATWSQYSSTRRALSSLRKKGLIVQLEGSFRYGRSRYALPEGAEEYRRRELEALIALKRFR